MAMDQHHGKSWQRLAAPARRWSGRVRAVFDLDREPDQRVHPRKDRSHIGSSACAMRDLRLPRQAEDQLSLLAIATERGCQRLVDRHIVRVNGRSMSTLASQQQVVTPRRPRDSHVRPAFSGQTEPPRSSKPSPRWEVRARVDSGTAPSAGRRRRRAFAVW